VKLVYAGVHEAQPGEVWTRSLPKVRIKSLAGFVLEEGEESGSKIVVTKPGPYEKIHECLVSQNEIRRARVKYSKFFDGVVIVIHPAWLDKQPAGVGFSKPYTSDEAEEMTQEDIRKMFQESKGEAV
jgi:FlaA1/EpsC-like NDP-sugar epimerase